MGLLFKNEVTRDDFLAGVWAHGIDAWKVRDHRVALVADFTVLAVDRDTGEVSHVLVGTGQLIEQGGLTAVLVSHQGKAQACALGKWILGRGIMESAFLSEAGVFYIFLLRPFFAIFLFFYKGDFYVRGIGKSESELIAVDADLHGIAHGGKFDYRDFRARNHSHIQKMLPQLALSANGFDACALAWF